MSPRLEVCLPVARAVLVGLACCVWAAAGSPNAAAGDPSNAADAVAQPANVAGTPFLDMQPALLVVAAPVPPADADGTADASAAADADSQVGSVFSRTADALRNGFVGLDFAHQGTNGIGLNGFDVFGGSRLFGTPLSLVADFGRVSGSTTVLDVTASERMWDLLVGPQVDVPHLFLSPYGHLLFGAANLSQSAAGASSAATAFAWDLGVGLAMHFAPFVELHILQVDFLHTGGVTYTRWSIGAAVHF